MVRRIRSCDTCNARFISLANYAVCQNCDQRQKLSSSLEARRLTQIAVEPSPQAVTAKHTGNENGYSSQDGDDSSIGSEGGDEVHCTQLELEVNEDDEEDDENLISLLNSPSDHPVEERKEITSNHSTQQVASIGTTREKSVDGGDICFICGVSLKTLKRRMVHIKRCAKKHAITGRDVKIDTENDMFAEAENEKIRIFAARQEPSSVNPYLRQSSWHGDANLTLKLATESTAQNQMRSPTIPSRKQGAVNQSSLDSFLIKPIRNLNNVLLAGARRLTKQAEIKAASLSEPKGQKSFPRGKKRGRGTFGQPRSYSSGCPSYKKISGTDFVCDGFHYAKTSLTKNYFLTHFHSDHYGGISKSWDAGTIYCSLPTAELVSQQLGVDRKYLHPLPMDTPVVVESKGKPVTVTLLDANHCPGAVMFLFEVGKRRILHVGDFRWNRDFMLRQGSPLRDFALEKQILDELYLDTTYCDPKYALPSQAETIDAIETLFQKELQRCKSSNNARTLHLFGAYTIGKEKMYLSVAEKHKMKVYVDPRRFRILSALKWPKERMALLTKNKEEACIWVVPLGDINMKKLPEYFPQANSKPFATPYDNIIGYRPTGWSLGSKPSSSLVSSRYNGNICIHSVPYSEHSSFPELVDCLSCLKPQCTIPTVSVKKSEEQVGMLMKALKEKQTTLSFK